MKTNQKTKPCKYCKGTGKISVMRGKAMTWREINCPKCEGTGKEFLKE